MLAEYVVCTSGMLKVTLIVTSYFGTIIN